VPLTFLHTAAGKMRSKKTLGNDFARWAKAAGLPDECRLHGLKKGGTRRGAKAQLTTHELKAKSGHKSIAMVEMYTEAARMKLLADSGSEKEREPAPGSRN
jgi:integrase